MAALAHLEQNFWRIAHQLHLVVRANAAHGVITVLCSFAQPMMAVLKKFGLTTITLNLS